MQRIVLLFVTVLSLNACATLVSTSEYTLQVDSAPAGATVRAYYRQNAPAFHEGAAPTAFQMDFGSMSVAENDAYFEVSLRGYATRKIFIRKTIDWWVLGNIWFWPIGLVDLGTGAMWKPEQQFYQVQLERAGGR